MNLTFSLSVISDAVKSSCWIALKILSLILNSGLFVDSLYPSAIVPKVSVTVITEVLSEPMKKPVEAGLTLILTNANFLSISCCSSATATTNNL